jgi:DNA topoisomerase-3
MLNEPECKAIFDKCKKALDKGEAKVTKITFKETMKLKPLPLNTVEATKLISNKLKISPEVSMAVMEKLYNMGYLSYPRTETNSYNPSINLRSIVNQLRANEDFGKFADEIANGT